MIPRLVNPEAVGDPSQTPVVYVGDALDLPGAIVCNGADEHGQRCGRTYRRGDETAARAAGWKVGRLPDGNRDAMCPACGKPDPVTVALAREIERGIGRAP
jgi:hypothetical protein